MLLACYGWKTKSRNQRERKREMSQRKWGKGYVELWETIWKRGEWSKEWVMVFQSRESRMLKTPSLFSFCNGRLCDSQWWHLESNGNPMDELTWKFTVFSSTRHNAKVLAGEVTRGEKVIKILRLFAERHLDGLKEMKLTRKIWVNSSSGHSERDQD